jgi:hypothetical protein
MEVGKKALARPRTLAQAVIIAGARQGIAEASAE